MTLGRCNLGVRYGHPSQEFSLVVRERVHGSKRNVEGASSSVVNGEHVDALASAGIRQLPAGTTARRVPSTNGESAANSREPWKTSEGRVPCGDRVSCLS